MSKNAQKLFQGENANAHLTLANAGCHERKKYSFFKEIFNYIF